MANLLKLGFQKISDFFEKEKPEMDVWGEGTVDLGAHISDYKEKRGYKLILRSFAIIIFVIALNLYSSFSTSDTSYWIAGIIKCVLAAIILFFHYSLIRSHLADQQKTIDLLKIESKTD